MKASTTLRSVPLEAPVDKYAPVLGQPFPVRIPPAECLRLAAKGRRDLDPSDVLALLAEDVAAERLRIKQMADQIDALRSMLFGKNDPAPTTTLGLIEKLNRVRLQEQSELRHSMALLHEMTTPKQAAVLLERVQVNRGTSCS
jgi:hypothetical protein